jgi:hypothetical protein
MIRVGNGASCLVRSLFHLLVPVQGLKGLFKALGSTGHDISQRMTRTGRATALPVVGTDLLRISGSPVI